MKISNKIKNGLLLVAVSGIVLSACNKLELAPTPTPSADNGTTPTLATLLDDPNFSLLKAAVTRVGLLPALSSPSARFTVFAPDDNAIRSSLAVIAPGVPAEAFIAGYNIDTLRGIIQYHVIPQTITLSSIPGTFPNFEYPSSFNPRPDLSALFRLSIFPSVRSNGAWANNVPITGVNIQAVNGVAHKVAAIVLSPSRYLWDTAASKPPLDINNSIFADTSLSYLKAAIIRADSGVAAGSRLVDALTNAGANLTVFAPTNNAMRAFFIGTITKVILPDVTQGLTAYITQQLINSGKTPEEAAALAPGLAVAQAPAAAQQKATETVVAAGTLILTNPYLIDPRLGALITPTLAKGIVAYHILSSQSGTYAPPGIRVFSVNLPATATAVKTLLNSAVSVHPGLTVQATFVSPAPGVSVVTAATVKGAANATASNVIVGRTTNDLHFVNGVMHKIDQLLLPQAF